MSNPEEQEKQEWLPDRTKFKDSMGRYKTQAIFLEFGYDTEHAVYTFKDEDFEYKGVLYPSLRRLYLEMEDPSEYMFAKKYLWGYEHWEKITRNKLLFEHIRDWREELEVRVRALGIKHVIDLSKGNFSAAKWVADGHWSVKRGRPSKEEQERERKIRERAVEEVSNDSDRVVDFVRKKDNA